MDSFVKIVLIASASLILVGYLLQKYFYRKQSFTYITLLFQPHPLLDVIPPRVKYSLTFKVPRYIRTHESDEIVVEYLQGITDFAIEPVNTFLYEELRMLPRSLPNGLRGLYLVRTTDKVKPKLETDLSVRANSPKISIAPEDWVSYKKGTTTPCRWRWSISCDDLGMSSIVFELSEGFQKHLSRSLQGRKQIIFQVDVRSDLGLSYRTYKILKALSLILVRGGGLLIVCITVMATLIASSPVVIQFFTGLLKAIFHIK